MHLLSFPNFGILERLIGDNSDLSKQASIAKAIEEKVSGEQRRFFLMEQFKAIKKVAVC
jgi:ATP-dependent Lon protease